MKTASDGGIPNGSIQVFHVHVLLVAPLDTGYMTQPSTDQHEGRAAVRENAHHTGAAADLPVQPFDDIVGMNMSPVFAGKLAVGQASSISPSNFWAASFSFMERSSSTTALAFSWIAFLLPWTGISP